MASTPFRLLCAALALATGAAASPVAPIAPTPRPMGFEEAMTGQRRLDLAEIAPDGRTALWSQARYDVPSHGGQYLHLSQFESFATDLATGARIAIRGPGLGGVRPQPYRAWSPGGRFASLQGDRDGAPAQLFWDQARRRTIMLGPAPSRLYGYWVGERLVYATDAGGPPNVQALADSLASMTARWRSAWNTPRLEATIHSRNPLIPAPDAPEGRLVVVSPATGQVFTLAEGAAYTVKPAPDGRTVAVLTAGEILPDALDRRRGRRGDLQIFRLTDRGAERIGTFADLDIGHGALAWSPDGRRLLAAGRRPGDPAIGALVVDLDGARRTWLPIPAGLDLGDGFAASLQSALQLGWIGGQPAFIARSAAPLKPMDGVRHDHGETLGSGLRLYAWRDGAAVSLTDFSSQSVDRFAVTSDGLGLVAADGRLWGVAPGAPPRPIGPESLKITGLAEAAENYGQGFTPALARADGRERVAVTGLDAHGAPRLAVLDVETGAVTYSAPAAGLRALSPRLDRSLRVATSGWSSRLVADGPAPLTLADPNPGWRDRPTGEVRPIAYSLAGRRLTGWVILPPGRQAAPPPALVWIYGGRVYGPTAPEETAADAGPTPMFNLQLWAARGYAVILPSTPLGRGADSDLRRDLADATVAAVDAAAAAGLVDPRRVGIMGHSFGGYSAAAVLSERSDRFRAGFAMSGVYDPAAAWGVRQAPELLVDPGGHSFAVETKGYIEEGLTTLGAPPWKAPAAYARISPFAYVADIKAPMLLTVGDLDLGVSDLRQTERFYAALIRTGNPAVAVRYWGQGHVQMDPAAVRDQWAKASAWFDHYVAEAARP